MGHPPWLYLKGAHLSRTELEVLRSLVDPEAFEEALAAAGLSPSRRREAKEKLFGR